MADQDTAPRPAPTRRARGRTAGGGMRCSFCGRGPAAAARLIAGPGVWICDACAAVCATILVQELGESWRRSPGPRLPRPAGPEPGATPVAFPAPSDGAGDDGDSPEGMAAADPGNVRCAFCGKDGTQAARIITGRGVAICDRCVALCEEILSEGPRMGRRGAGRGGRSRRQAATLRCSFCGKDSTQARRLVAGPGVYICDECATLCCEIIAKELGEARPARPAAPLRLALADRDGTVHTLTLDPAGAGGPSWQTDGDGAACVHACDCGVTTLGAGLTRCLACGASLWAPGDGPPA